MMFAAVLSGDLIGSTNAAPSRIDHSMALISSAAARVSIDSHFTRYRGDGWQIYLAEPRLFLWATVYLNAVLKADPKGLPTRISIGLGTANNLGESGLAGASGTAFVHSGRALDASNAVGRTLALSGEGTDDVQRSLIAFVEDRMNSWSPEQAEAVALKLAPARVFPDSMPTQDEMSLALGISRQAVGARLKAAGWALIYNACVAIHDHFEDEAIKHA